MLLHKKMLKITFQDFFIVQPGSPVATSLCEGEALRKHVGILSIRADNKVLTTDNHEGNFIRPFFYCSVNKLLYNHTTLI